MSEETTEVGSDVGAESDSASDDSIDWGALADEANEATEDTSAAEPDVADTKEAPPPAEEPAAPPTEVKATPETPAAPQAPPVRQEQAQPVARQLSAEQIAAQDQQIMQALEQHHQLTEDEVAEFQVNPGAVLPRIAAKLHAEIYKSVVTQLTQSMTQQLPAQVAGLIQQRDGVQKAETAFYQHWEELKAHPRAVDQAVRMFRQSNPGANLQQIIEKAGPVAWTLAGLGPQQLMQKLNPQRQQAAEPAQTGYRPANPRGSAPQAPQSTNPWGDLTLELENL